MKSLLRLLPYLRRYRRTLFGGLLTVVGSNIFTVAQPLFLGKAIDAFKSGVEQNIPVYDELFDLYFSGLGEAIRRGAEGLMEALQISEAELQALIDRLGEILADLEIELSSLAEALLR